MKPRVVTCERGHEFTTRDINDWSKLLCPGADGVLMSVSPLIGVSVYGPNARNAGQCQAPLRDPDRTRVLQEDLLELREELA